MLLWSSRQFHFFSSTCKLRSAIDWKARISLDCSILPESPRWLISKGHYEHAERILRRIAKKNGKNFDSTEYQRLINAEKQVRGYVFFCKDRFLFVV